MYLFHAKDSKELHWIKITEVAKRGQRTQT